MNYKKLWNTLKAESGYRTTLNFINKEDQTIRELMNRLELRKKEIIGKCKNNKKKNSKMNNLFSNMPLIN